MTAFVGEEISIPTTVIAGGNAAEIPAWTANPVTPNGNMSQQGVTDSSGNLWFVTDDGVVQKVADGNPDPAHVPTDGTGIGTGVLTTIPGISGAAGEYVSKPIILDVGGQDYMFVAGQNSATEATMHKIRLSDGNRQSFSSLTGGSEKLKGLSEHNGKIYFAYSTTNANSRGGIARLNTAGGMSLDTSFSGNGRLLLQNGRDFGITGTGAQVEIAFDSADNLYVTADRTDFFGGFPFNQPTLRSWDANGVNRSPTSRDVGGFNTATGGLAGNTVHSPVVDGANIYIALDRSGFGGTNQIEARRTSDGSLNTLFTTINFGGERVIENPVVSGANLYVSTDQGKVHSYNKTTGAFVATFDSGSAGSLTMPTFDGTDFYVGQGSRVHKVDSGTMTRDATWPAPGVSAAGAIEAPPLVVGTEVYVGSPSRIQGFEAPIPSTTLTDQTGVQKTPGGNDYLSTHSVGDTFNVTVKTGATPTDWTGTATVVDVGGVGKLNITGFSGTTDLTGKLTVNVVSPPITPTLPTSLKIGSNYVTGDTPTVTVNKPGPDNTPGNADDTSENLLSTGATPKVKVITAAMIGTPGFDAAAYGAGDLGKLDIDLTGVTPDGTGNYNLTATAGSRYLQATTFNNQGTIGAYPATETPELKSITDSGGVAVTGVTATSGVADVNGQLDIVLSGTPSATGTLTLTFDGPLTATPATTLSNVGTNYAPGEVVLVTTNVPKQGGGTNFLTATATNNNNGTLTISALNGIPSSSSSTVANAYNVTANPGTIHHLPNENPAATTGSYGNGEVVGISLIDTGTGVAPVDALAAPITATGTGQADGSVLIAFSGTPTSSNGITVKVDPGNLSAAPTTPGSLAGVGTGYATVALGEALNVGAAITVPGMTATATNQNDGTVNIALAGAVTPGTTPGAYTVTANAGTVRHLPNENPAATTGSYGNGEVVAVTLTDTGTGVAPVDALAAPITATGTGQADGSVLIAFSGTPNSSNAITVKVDPGNLTAAPTTPGSLTGVGTGYATVALGEALNVGAVTTVPGMTATATNQNDGKVNIALAGAVTPGTSPGAYTVTANAGSVRHLPNENPAAATGSYGNGEVVGISLTDTGTGVAPVDALAAPITATGTGQADGSVLIAFSGTPTSSNAITIKVDPGNLTAAPTTAGSLTGIGTGYATGEAVTANVTGVAGMTATATNNNNGTLNIGLGAVPAGTAPGTYQVQANPGATFQLPNENIAANTGSYGNGEVVAVALTDNVTGLAPAGGLTASGTGQGDGSLQITFTNSPTSANPIQVAPATGSPSLAQTSLSNVGSGYNPAEPIPTITVTDPGGTDVTGTAAVTGINAADGSLNVDLTGVTLTAASPTGTYTVATSNGTIASIPTALNGIGSGYSPADTPPTVTVTDPLLATLTGATASINPNGTLSINLAGVAATAAGSYTVNATGGTGSGMQQGLDDTGKDLWDFSHADFKNFIQTLTNVRAVNGATTSSLAFSESRLETNIQNLELAGGRIVDADMAEEMVEVAKSQILLQTATDSLTKHNRLSVDVDRTLMGLSGGM